MPSQGRLGDKSQTPADGHGCPGCPHPALGPATKASSNVFVNSERALRVNDTGIHKACCGPNIWEAVEGSATVFINGKAAHRMGDKTKHCGGDGKLIHGSKNVFVGDSGGSAKCACNQAQLMKDASKSGTPFFEGPKTPLEIAKQAAAAKAKQAAQEMAQKAVQTASGAAEQVAGIAGKGGSQKQSKDDGLKLKEAGFSGEAKEGYTDFDPQTKIKLGVEVEKKIYDEHNKYYGNENANIKIGQRTGTVGFGYGYDVEKGTHEAKVEAKAGVSGIVAEAKGKSADGYFEGSAKATIGHAEASAGFGYGYDPEKDGYTLGAEAKAKVSVIEGEAKGTAARGLLEVGAKGEALSAGAEASTGVTWSKDKVEAGAKAGAEANLVKGEAEGKINITPKTIYDNTIGSVVGWASPDSKYKSAAKWLDHGVVIGAKGEAGIGAAASAEAKAGATKEMIYAEAGVKLGAGPMAGVKLLLGIK